MPILNKEQAVRKWLNTVRLRCYGWDDSFSHQPDTGRYVHTTRTMSVQIDYDSYSQMWSTYMKSMVDEKLRFEVEDVIDIFAELWQEKAEIPYDYWQFQTPLDLLPEQAEERVRAAYRTYLERQGWCERHQRWITTHEEGCVECNEEGWKREHGQPNP